MTQGLLRPSAGEQRGSQTVGVAGFHFDVLPKGKELQLLSTVRCAEIAARPRRPFAYPVPAAPAPFMVMAPGRPGGRPQDRDASPGPPPFQFGKEPSRAPLGKSN